MLLIDLINFLMVKKIFIGVWGDGTIGYITALLLKFLYPQSKIIVFGKHQDKLSYFTFVDETYLIHQIPSKLRLDHTFECVGGHGAQIAIEQIIDTIKPEGTISLLGVSEYPILINTRMVLEKGLRLYGSSRSSRKDFENTLKFLEKFPEIINYLENLIIAVCPIRTIGDINHAFERDKQVNFGKTILLWDK